MEEIMDNEPKVTEPVVETTKTEVKEFTQKDLSNLVAKEVKTAQEKMLKELGVEDFKSAKDGLNKYKESQEAQKTDYEKLTEKYNALEKSYNDQSVFISERKKEDKVSNVLKSLNIDTKYVKAISKLTDFTDVKDEDYQSVIEKTIDEELPILRSSNEKITKVGIEQGKPKVDVSNSTYLDAFNKLKGKK